MKKLLRAALMLLLFLVVGLEGEKTSAVPAIQYPKTTVVQGNGIVVVSPKGYRGIQSFPGQYEGSHRVSDIKNQLNTKEEK